MEIYNFKSDLGNFYSAAEATKMAMIFSDGGKPGDPVVFANDAFLAMTGLGHEDLIGVPLGAVLGRITDSHSLSLIQQSIGTGREGSWEMPCQRADKSEFLAAAFFCPLRDEQGVVSQNFISFVELGGHIDRLMTRRNEFHAIYENAPGFIATTQGPEHRISFANASYKRFVGRDSLEGLSVVEALPEIVEQGIIELLDQVYQTGEAFVGKSMQLGILESTSGIVETRYIDVVYQPVRGATGEITGLFCEGYDVTAQHEANDALASLRAELIYVSRVNAMGTMATTLAHELNQPLSAIANYAAGMRLAQPAELHSDHFGKAILGIEEASRRATDIIRNLRELTVRREPAKAAFALNAAVGECVNLVHASIWPGIEFFNQVPNDLQMLADRVQIQQVIVNLLLNACDAVSASDLQQIRICARECGDELVVSVVDTGPGVSAEMAEGMFSWSGSSKVHGMGLGLSICRTIIEAHRGRIWLENSGSPGAEFCFSVPL